MTTRAVARDIVALRRALIARLAAELADDEPARNLAQLQLLTIPAAWPLGIQMRVDLDRYVQQPAQRKIDREGILAQVAEIEITIDTTAWDTALRDLTENRENK